MKNIQVKYEAIHQGVGRGNVVTNTNKRDRISEFFLWSDDSPPLTAGERLQSWKWGIRPRPSPVPPDTGRGGQAHLEQLALSGSLWLWSVETRELLPLPSPLAG